jgi:three-Cys-motif partner protein
MVEVAVARGDMNYNYGERADQVHPFFMEKRPWSRVKDKIVGDYITCYLKTIQHRHRPILIVDAFAGPGRFGDNSEGSPLIICNAIDRAPKGGVGIGCLFADAHLQHRTELEACLKDYIRRGVSERPYLDCAEALSRALEIGTGSTLFFYLDPYGIKDLDFEMVKQIYARNPRQSTEVLINFNFRAFMRLSGNWSYGDSASTIANKVKQSKIETVDRVMGGQYWLKIITNPTLDKLARENAVVSAYMDKVREFFRFTYSIPVKERDESVYEVPADELARYHLIFGTRSPRAVTYMNDVARNALEPYFNQFKEGLLFDMTPDRYQPASTDEVKSAIVQAVAARGQRRPQIYETIVPRFFMHYRLKDYRAMIDQLAFVEHRLFPDKRTMRRANQLNDDTILSAMPWPD